MRKYKFTCASLYNTWYKWNVAWYMQYKWQCQMICFTSSSKSAPIEDLADSRVRFNLNSSEREFCKEVCWDIYLQRVRFLVRFVHGKGNCLAERRYMRCTQGPEMIIRQGGGHSLYILILTFISSQTESPIYFRPHRYLTVCQIGHSAVLSQEHRINPFDELASHTAMASYISGHFGSLNTAWRVWQPQISTLHFCTIPESVQMVLQTWTIRYSRGWECTS